MKIRYLCVVFLCTFLFCMNIGIDSFAEEPEDSGIWTYVSASIPYELEGMQIPPETAVLTLQDELSGLEYEREVPLKRITEKETLWVDGFSFPITVSGYDADVFLLGNVEIPADADLALYGEELLRAAGLSKDHYRVETVEWVGESYEEEGVLMRDALASGEKLIRRVEVFYGGQVRTPKADAAVNAETEAVAEEIEEIEQETRIQETMAETLSEDPVIEESVAELDFLEKVRQWIREHVTIVSVSIGIIFVLLGVLVLWKYQRRKSRN